MSTTVKSWGQRDGESGRVTQVLFKVSGFVHTTCILNHFVREQKGGGWPIVIAIVYVVMQQFKS